MHKHARSCTIEHFICKRIVLLLMRYRLKHTHTLTKIYIHSQSQWHSTFTLTIFFNLPLILQSFTLLHAYSHIRHSFAHTHARIYRFMHFVTIFCKLQISIQFIGNCLADNYRYIDVNVSRTNRHTLICIYHTLDMDLWWHCCW